MLLSKIEKVPKGIQGEKSSKDKITQKILWEPINCGLF